MVCSATEGKYYARKAMTVAEFKHEFAININILPSESKQANSSNLESNAVEYGNHTEGIVPAIQNEIIDKIELIAAEDIQIN